MWKTGHALVKAKLKETGAPLAGEMSGHVFFKERWYGFDDGLYAGARLLEILSRADDANAILKALPDSSSTPELNIGMQEGEPFALIDELQRHAHFEGAREIITIDGLRVEYADGFGLARPSNTTPVVVLRFEADNARRARTHSGRFSPCLRHRAPRPRAAVLIESSTPRIRDLRADDRTRTPERFPLPAADPEPDKEELAGYQLSFGSGDESAAACRPHGQRRHRRTLRRVFRTGHAKRAGQQLRVHRYR
jgi:hypothetical protein